jgi:hypothetical protein
VTWMRMRSTEGMAIVYESDNVECSGRLWAVIGSVLYTRENGRPRDDQNILFEFSLAPKIHEEIVLQIAQHARACKLLRWPLDSLYLGLRRHRPVWLTLGGAKGVLIIMVAAEEIP